MDESLYNDYEEFLPGLTPEHSEDFLKIAQTFSENVFELLQIKQEDGETVYATPYMMSDAIESFIIYEDAHVKGKFKNKKEECVTTGKLQSDNQGHMLIVHQNDGSRNNFVTIRFSGIHSTQRLYQYHNIGHFWIPEYEFFRQLDYRLWIIRDKYEFFGESACNEKELALLKHYEFGPLRFYECIDWENKVINPCSCDGVDQFIKIAEDVGDTRMVSILKRYRKHQSKLDLYTCNNGIYRVILRLLLHAVKNYYIAYLLRTKRHFCICERLCDMIKDASSEYDLRSFGEKYDNFLQECHEKLRGYEYLEEQPFTIDKKFKYSFHLIKWINKRYMGEIEIKTIKLEGSDISELRKQFEEGLAK